ncbi:MAG: YwbE family protein [bacterium]
MNGCNRNEIKAGLLVDVVLKKDQGTEILTRGIVKDILTNALFHPHGIKVRLQDGQIGRIARILQYLK